MKTNKLAPVGTGKNSAWLGQRTPGTEARYRKGGNPVASARAMDLVGGFGEPQQTGTSIFDPVLCELVYRWFCPPGGTVLDPFAGGSVRGIVAAKCGLEYIGIELSGRQIESNRSQSCAICTTGKTPQWINADSRTILSLKLPQVDLVFSCPPYGDLEVYSDDGRDLSTMPPQDFLKAYREIIAAACSKLKPNRFAVFVVGDYRDSKGFYCNFPSETINAFQACGLRLYNEAVLVTAVGSLPIRVGRCMQSGRKLGKTHQNVLAFFNGDPRKVKSDFGECQFGEADAHAQSPALPGIVSPEGNAPDIPQR